MSTRTEPATALALTVSKRTLALELGVSVRTVERLRAAGVLPPTVPGLSHPRWSTEAIMAWLRSGRAVRRV